MKRNSGVLSEKKQLLQIAHILKNYVRLPFSPINVPGAVLEGVLAHVRKAEVLRTYDFVDVVDRNGKIGWQIKSTLAQTPVTWKRAKLPDSNNLIEKSEKSEAGLQALGDAIINFCNLHAQESLRIYELDQIGFARLIIHEDGRATYYERLLCTRKAQDIFRAKDFSWSWSKQKETTKKEQLTALHGIHIPTGKKWFAWHGRGENQLHFSGERNWWPTGASTANSLSFKLPGAADRLSLEKFIDLLAASENPLPHAN